MAYPSGLPAGLPAKAYETNNDLAAEAAPSLLKTDPRLAAAIGLSSLQGLCSEDESAGSTEPPTDSTSDQTPPMPLSSLLPIIPPPASASAAPYSAPYTTLSSPTIKPSLYNPQPHKPLGKSAPTLAHVPNTLKCAAGPGVWDNSIYPMPPTRAIHPTYTGPPLAPPQPPGGLSLNRAAATAPLAGFPAHGYPHYAHPYGVLQLPPHQQRPPYGAVIPGFFPPPSGMTLARPYPDPGVDPNGNAKSFPETLMDIINDERYHHIISWIHHGRGFVIHDRNRFTNLVLMRFFDGAKFTSFTRRLKRWRFVRIPRGPELGAYYNPYFVRDAPMLINKMRLVTDSQADEALRQGAGDYENGEMDEAEKAASRSSKKLEQLLSVFPKPAQAPMVHDGTSGSKPQGIDQLDGHTAYDANMAAVGAAGNRAMLPAVGYPAGHFPPPVPAKTDDQIRILEIERELLLHKQARKKRPPGVIPVMPQPMGVLGRMPPPAAQPYYPTHGAPHPGMMAMPFVPVASMHAMPPMATGIPLPGYPAMIGTAPGACAVPPPMAPGAASRPLLTMTQAEEVEFAEYLVNKRMGLVRKVDTLNQA